MLAETHPVGSFRRKVATLVDTARFATLADRHAAAVQTRRVWVQPGVDGMAWLMAQLPAVEARAVFSRATAMAKAIAKEPGEARTLDQLRADVIADLLIDGEVAAHQASTRGIRAEVVVTVPALALLDAEPSPRTLPDADAEPNPRAGSAPVPDAEPASVAEPPPASGAPVSGAPVVSVPVVSAAAGFDPPVVEGVGPIPVDTARVLCGTDARWMRVLTHPETGMVLSVGRERYTPPRSLQKLVRWRADTCLAPGCNQPASRCQIDHQLAWSQGGSTSLENNAPLCQGHHTVKHHGNWIVRQVPGSGGVIEWISPTGRRHLVEPERRVPTFTPAPAPPTTAPF